MKKICTIAVSAVFLMTTSCASIVSKSSWPITINSTPSEAKISITDKKGIEIYNGHTPATLELKSGSGFFGKARYQVKFEKNGFESKTVPVEFKLNGWYFGNLLIGGVIGMLIVDPATGAMYRLETKFLNETLLKKDTIGFQEKEGLKIMELSDIPEDWKNHLVQLEN